ncbi:MAG: pyridoxal phosphate-dependent aminotransferase [Chlorobium sp.]|uniref:pyridoxal phosphate-dependent aminotransferase n=1 Tax=Chlorobium sp. TaxID=1095 RepID=UPI0025BE80C6|nr:pyridoxal phosphate-dependent aminotransferase [Chlorobium sp.]MCF8215684.1 pyridoxal phosphate-dependent aminotransferase [Chlorobium sp.]MCF8270582.1 pyridoxal phosphate-dependent aminotransferase [Chlorobium sp.]MCF8286893.1 pyridoxal phosphate-dependent aminotransferase [Chlorobium sp.]MCF8290489.1 pyridoxal phosphate-dependent aminotransferase [Chlorobium sp.]MCF8384575.1 pyridoxal phosphate-dependent aminotransferase [Chlorobium sp.]
MSLTLGSRNGCVMQSEIRAMSIACAHAGGINLSQGVCDTPVPAEISISTEESLRHGYNTYTHYAGLGILREAIAEKQRHYNGLDVDPDSEIVVSAGATGAMYCAFQALLSPGDEVIVFEPFYGYHISTLVAAEAIPVFVSLDTPGWTFTAQKLEHVVTSGTKGIILNTPSNPSGKVFSRQELEIIAAFAARYDLFVFTDEIYEHFVYEGEHCSFASLPGMKARTITVSGFSKTFSITGWRLGYSICDARWAAAIGYFNDLVYVCAPAPLQAGVAEGMQRLDEGYYRTLSEVYKEKRDRFCGVLAEAGLAPFVPQGAYYVLAEVGHLPGETASERARFILDTTGVACVPGSAFYGTGRGENLVRFCYAKEDAVLDEACRRLCRLR